MTSTVFFQFNSFNPKHSLNPIIINIFAFSSTTLIPWTLNWPETNVISIVGTETKQNTLLLGRLLYKSIWPFCWLHQMYLLHHWKLHLSTLPSNPLTTTTNLTFTSAQSNCNTQRWLELIIYLNLGLSFSACVQSILFLLFIQILCHPETSPNYCTPWTLQHIIQWWLLFRRLESIPQWLYLSFQIFHIKWLRHWMRCT